MRHSQRQRHLNFPKPARQPTPTTSPRTRGQRTNRTRRPHALPLTPKLPPPMSILARCGVSVAAEVRGVGGLPGGAGSRRGVRRVRGAFDRRNAPKPRATPAGKPRARPYTLPPTTLNP